MLKKLQAEVTVYRHFQCKNIFLTRWIRISESLARDRDSYLTYVNPPAQTVRSGLSIDGLGIHLRGRQVTSILCQW